jgi:hypothetical protein
MLRERSTSTTRRAPDPIARSSTGCDRQPHSAVNTSTRSARQDAARQCGERRDGESIRPDPEHGEGQRDQCEPRPTVALGARCRLVSFTISI